VLDRSHTSQWWWKDHKKWLFYRFPQLTLQKMDGHEYLIYSDINNNNNNNFLKKNIKKNDTLSTLHSSKEIKI